MRAARRQHEQRFAQRIPASGFAFDQEFPDFLGARGTARLARGDGGDAGAGERLNEEMGLRRFPRPLAAFQRDEAAAPQRLLPQSR
jgi:hypothetical protein